jgi:serine/threonine protein kinase
MIRNWIVDVSDYKLIQKVGEGAFGVVYQAEKLSTHEIVAVKWLKRVRRRYDQVSFVREISIPAEIRHPAIVPFHGFRLQPDPQHDAMIVSKFMSKGSVPCRLEKPDAPILPRARLSIIFYGVAHALAALHKARVIHRDLKPANILLDENYRPYLSDFGLSRMIPEPSEADVAAELQMSVVGTPLCMAPEMENGHSKATYDGPPVDVYAYGVTIVMTMYRSLRECAFADGVQLDRNLRQHIAAGKRLRRPRGLPDNWWAIIEDCWAQDPEFRPTCAQICQTIGKPEYSLDPAAVDEYMAYVAELGPPAGIDKPPVDRPPGKVAKPYVFARNKGSG